MARDGGRVEIAMSYLTTYSLDLHNCTDEEIENFSNELYELSGEDEDVQTLLNEGVVDQAKLYDLSDQILEVSKHYPKMLIVLEGDGEDRDDVWEHRFLNGNRLERYVIMFPVIDDHPEFMTQNEIDCRKRIKEMMKREEERTQKFLDNYKNKLN